MDETMVSAFTAACSFQRLDLALVNPGTVQTILVDDVTAAGGTAEEWSDGDLTTVRGAEKLRDWIMMKSPGTVWFCCPTARRQKIVISQQLSLALVISPGNIASSVTCPILQQTWHPLVNVIFVLEIPWNSRAVRFGDCIHERLKGFHCAWVPACAWGLRTDSIGHAEGGWRVVTSMRSVLISLFLGLAKRHIGIAQSKACFHQLRVFLTCVAD